MTRSTASGAGASRATTREMTSSEPTRDVAHYDDGSVRSRGFQLDGEMHGDWEFLRRDGSVMRAGAFDRGRQIGVWRTFDRAGRVVKETDFSMRRS